MNVVILDTGCANLSSVKSAIQRLGYTPQVSRDADIVLKADKLFLPGVGTAHYRSAGFADAGPRPAAAPYGLEPRHPAGGTPPVSRH